MNVEHGIHGILNVEAHDERGYPEVAFVSARADRLR